MASQERRRRGWPLLFLLLALAFLAAGPAAITAARIIARGDDDGGREELEAEPQLPAEAPLAGGGASGSAPRAAAGPGHWAPWPAAPGWDGHRGVHEAAGGSLGDGRPIADATWSNAAASGTAARGGDPASGDRSVRPAAGQPMLSGPPGRATPVAPPQSGSVHVDWDYQLGSHTFHCSTTLDIGAAGPDDLRRQVTVTTRDQAGRLLVSYPGTAFLDADGALHVDARNAPVSGPWASQWSPDSFAVDQYGQARTLDDFSRPGGGWATPAGS